MVAVARHAAIPTKIARPVATAALFVLPLALLHARAGAEIAIVVIDALFLLHTIASRAAACLRTPFAWAAVAWWIWQIIASLAGMGGLGLALAAIRLPILALALRYWLLSDARARQNLAILLALSAGWIIVECWQQYAFGVNMFGNPRWNDGALTGPFRHPRAGPELILILFPVLLPAVVACLQRQTANARVAAALLAAGGAFTMILIGQRMPVILMVLGLALTCFFLPRLRLALAGIALAAALLMAALPIISPPAYEKLVVHTEDQLHHFAGSAYGQIWVRAAVMARQHPWLGLGVNGFRRHCNDPASIQGLPQLGVSQQEAEAATQACNIHPHNYYIEAAVDGGLPLLTLFSCMVVAALITLLSGLRRQPDPQRVGLWIGAALAFCPIASTSAFAAMPNAGWIFLVLGMGFAAHDAARVAARA